MLIKDNDGVNVTDKLNLTELRAVYAQHFGVYLDADTERGALIHAIKTDSLIIEENKIDRKRSDLINFILENFEKVRPQMSCDGMCTNCTDGQVTCCWILNQQYLKEDHMPQQDIMPLPAKKEDILPLERYEEENVFENATWITRFLLQFGLTRWDELNDSIKKNPDYARDMAKSFIRKVNKELNGDDADEEPNEEQEEVEEEKQVEEPPKPKRKRGRPPKNKNKKDKTKKKNEEQECAGKSIIPEILTAVEELSKKVDEELGGLWKKQEDQTELLEGLPKKIATDQAILEAKIDAIATMVAPELFSTPGTPFYSENDDPEDE